MSAYWRRHPPLHLLVAAFLGHKPKDEPNTVNSSEELDRLISSLPSM